MTKADLRAIASLVARVLVLLLIVTLCLHISNWSGFMVAVSR
jgi:hypothetical protein